MPYIKQVWVDRETPLDAEHLNHIEVGIYDAHDLIAELESGKADVDHNHTGTYAPATHSHDYAPSNHNHDLLYSPLTHNHDNTYAAKSHSHDYAATNHNHEGVYSPVLHDHDGVYSTEGHTHDDRYYTETEVDTRLGGKADAEHTHTKSDITDFPTSMTPTAHNHTRSEITDFPTSMPPTEHNHDSDYYKKTETYSKTEIDNMVGDIETLLGGI
jgi:hypothetical protein